MKRVLVVGDVFADVYRDCTFKKMCPDAPSVKAVVVHSTDTRPGGAANVAVNLTALAPDVRVSLIGEIDTEFGRLLKRMTKNKLDMEYCAHTDDMLKKERVSLGDEMIVRVDNRASVGTFAAEEIEARISEYFAENDPDLVVVSDYAQGSLSEAAWSMILSVRDRVLVDTKKTDLSFFCDKGWRTKLIKLNHEEWWNVIATEAAPEQFFQSLIVTHGRHGAIIKKRERIDDSKSITNTLRVNGHGVEAVDVCGCGDTFLAGLAASLLKNDDEFTAVQFANAAAATVVTQARTSVADLELTLGMLGRGE